MRSMNVSWIQRLALLVVLLSWGCSTETAPPPPNVVIDTAACLGSVENLSATTDSCRTRVSRSTNSRTEDPTGCFIVESAQERRVVPTVWLEERIEMIGGQDIVNFDNAQELAISLFTFSTPENASRCSTLGVESECTAADGCLLKLGPQRSPVSAGQDLTFDFKIDQDTCLLSASSTVLGTGEQCDGFDNDCDGRIDEEPVLNDCDVQKGENCRVRGIPECLEGTAVCTEVANLPDICGGRDNGDDDCDGIVDEDCTGCTNQQDCTGGLLCIDNRCVECGENSDCPAERSLCDQSQCRGCLADQDCGAQQVCDAPSGRCGSCSTAAGSSQCLEEQTCNPRTLTCGNCEAQSAPCLSPKICVGGVCGTCDPSGLLGAQCGVGLVCADDRANGFGYRCRPCNPLSATNECADGTYCVATADDPESSVGTCERCDPSKAVGSNGCFASAPICAIESDGPDCVPCNDAGRACPEGSTCVNGRCDTCDSTVRPSECSEDTPICESSSNTCQPCTRSSECREAFDGAEIRDTCVAGECKDCDSALPVTENGCDSSSDSPICRNNQCEPCMYDADCAGLNISGRAYCISGQCVACSPASNQPCTANREICNDSFECTACSADNDECASSYGDGYTCYGNQCRQCNPDAAIGDNGCPDVRPLCNRANDSCVPCSNDTQCLCDTITGRCIACDPNPNELVTTEVGTSQYIHNRGCEINEGTCEDGACRACTSDLDCPLGQCRSITNLSGTIHQRCRLETEANCRSNGLLFDNNTKRCVSCSGNSDCPGSLKCRDTGAIDDITGALVKKCNGCDENNVCSFPDGYRPICHIPDNDGNRVVPSSSLWVCRTCSAEVPNDCGNERVCCSEGSCEGRCVTCFDSTPDGVDQGCIEGLPNCVDGECTSPD